MSEPRDPKHGVTVVRAASIDEALKVPGGGGRTTVFNFAGSGVDQTWIGRVSLAPDRCTGLHHHGRHEVAFYVIEGDVEIRWGASLEFAANLAPGDVAYFAPHVPHQERNLSGSRPVEFLVIRTDGERIAVPIEGAIAATPTYVA